ncbi:aldo/keto reductase [Thiohalomonas denitrificans]|uniref:aldo/keto reductase n=1 Tax=Thiohalomonas denitrificans TaxID=415747 RepID=UPI0026ED6B68|nr:aldo/keto reductase [Thiohalomonas denitrificans]
MELRLLGSTGIRVSPLGLGTVKLGRDQQVKYPRGFRIPGDDEVRNLFALARDLGINFVDTAPAYGTSEERLGRLLPNRNDWVIVTKVGEIFENGRSRFDFSAEHTRMSVERSLKRLGRDHVDIVLVHSDGDDLDIIENRGALDCLADLKREGLIRAYGMSTKTEAGGLWVVRNCDVVMATCNPVDTHDLPVIAEAERLNRGVLVKKGLQSGHADSSAGGCGIEEAMRFVFAHRGVGSMIVGTINPDHLRRNVETVNRILAAQETG